MTTYREEGNAAFAKKDFDAAIRLYTLAINATENASEIAKCYSNRAQCFLNTDKNKEALEDANKALDLNINDTKAHFRKCIALERLESYAESLNIIKKLLTTNPENQEFVKVYQRITLAIRKKNEEINSTVYQSKHMLELFLDCADDNAKRKQAINALIEISATPDGAQILYEMDVLGKLSIFTEKSDIDTAVLVLRVFCNISKNSFDRAEKTLNILGTQRIGRLISSENKALSDVTAFLLDRILFSIADLENKRKIKKPVNVPYEFDKNAKKYIDEIFYMTGNLIGESSCSGYGRDNLLDIVLKFADRESSCAWSTRFIPFGIPKVLRVAASVEKLPRYLPLTEVTKMHAACTLSAIYDDLCSDRERDEFRNTCDQFVRELLNENTVESNIKAIACVTVILQGPTDVGNAIIGTQNMIELMLKMAGSNDTLQEKIALDAVLSSSSKADKAVGILSQGCDVLKKLYASTDEDVKVRALLGLCKISSSKGSDFSKKTVSEDSFRKLFKACCRLVCKGKNFQVKRYATDALAYLTLDGSIKESLIENKDCVSAIFKLVKTNADPSLCFTVASILVNLTNAYEVKKPDEELIKLAEYAKHHIPEQHPKDSEKHFLNRRQQLMDLGVCPVLVHLAKEKSEACREMVARVFLALSEEQSNRGIIVASGGGKALLPLAVEGNATTRIKASQALAKIAISCNPEIAFPGQRCLEVIRPLVSLLHPDRTGLENFEALLALTNLASINSTIRKKILNDDFASIEHYMYEDHVMLRRAATEVICNLAAEPDAINKFTGDNDRVKALVLFCGEEDLLLNKAAAGTLCQISYSCDIVCQKIVSVKTFATIFMQMATCSDVELQFRAFYILHNLVFAGKEFATVIVNSELMDAIVAMSKFDDPERTKVTEVAKEVVVKCLEDGYIKPSVDAFH